MRADQLLIAITIAPTTAIRVHNSSLSPKRFNRLRMTGPPSIITLSKEARQMPGGEWCFFRFF
jgi:hypothetical protein